MELGVPVTAESDFVLKCLKQGLRVDGRRPLEQRPLRITLEHGYCQVMLGKTRVVASVHGEIVRPSFTQSNEGSLVVRTELTPSVSMFLTHRQREEREVLISRMLEKAIQRSRAVDTESLCIVAGDKVWMLRIDVRVLDHYGNILDCACAAAITALLQFRRPDVSVKGSEVVVHDMVEKNPLPLSIHHIPLCVTVNFFDNGEIMILDPTLSEEKVSKSEMTYVVNAHNELCALSKPGGEPVPLEQVLSAMQVIKSQALHMTSVIKDAISAASQGKGN